MKILEQNAGLLSNVELAQLLLEKGVEDTGPNSKALPSEKVVYEYLRSHVDGMGSQQLQPFFDAVKDLALTKAELLQLLNLRPTTPVEIHLVVEECEGRLSEEQVEVLLAAVEQHLGARPTAGQQQQQQGQQEQEES